MPSANYLDDEEDLLPSSPDFAQQQLDNDFEQDVAKNPLQMPPGMLQMVQTPRGPLPVVVAPPDNTQGDDNGTPAPSDNAGWGVKLPPSAPSAPPITPQTYQEPKGQTGDDDGEPSSPAMPPGARFNGAPGGVPLTANADPVLQKVAQTPTMGKPKWWQLLGAGAFGGLAGWSNAAGRTRNPINIAGVQDEILHPGYKEQMARFQSELNPIMQGYNLEAARNAAAYKNQATAAKAGLENAQAQQNLARGAYWLHRAATETSHYRVGPKGEVVDTWTGQVQYAPQTPAEQVAAQAEAVKQLVKQGWSQRDAQLAVFNKSELGKAPTQRNMNPTDVLMHPRDFTPEEVRNAQNIFDREHRGPNEVATELARARLDEQRANQNTAINTKFEADKDRLIKERRAALSKLETGVASTPDVAKQAADINKAYAQQLQSLQNVYEQNIRDHHGTPSHTVVGVDATTGEPTWSEIPTPLPITGQPAPQQTAQQTAPQVPPLSVLKPGVVRHFKNGQSWTVGPDGKPLQVNATPPAA